MLGPLGHEVVTASSGEAALKAVLKGGEFAVVLLDVRMPGMDGLETATEMKRLARSASVPIIFLTGDSQPERVSLGYALGAADYILKPVDPDTLRAKVNAFVELYRARQELKQQAVTLQRELDEQRRLNETLDQFSGMVAHDLRNPLQAMASVFEMLASDDILDPVTQERVVEIGRRQAQRAQELIDGLLQLARASATPQLEPIDLPTLVSEVSSMMPSLDIRSELKVARVVADPVPIRQALINLLENAARYGSTGDGPNVVVVGAQRGPGGVILSVSDRGPGLSEEDSVGVFAAFKRGEAGIDHEGTGLGLSIVAAAARAHGGQAWYEQRPGGGACFRILIPQKDDR
jgi:signal transduction histidine kinase